MKNKRNKILQQHQQRQQQKQQQRYQPQQQQHQQQDKTELFESKTKKKRKFQNIKERPHHQHYQQQHHLSWLIFLKTNERKTESSQGQPESLQLFSFVQLLPIHKSNSFLLLLKQLLLFALLCNMSSQTTADWLMDCGDCHCKWNSGKKTADCKNLTLTAVPENLSNEIQVLDLSQNRIVYLEENCFLNADLTNLHKLYIRNSTLQHIDPRSFSQLEILIELDLSNNLLRLLQTNQFARLVKVRAIILNGNQLETLGDNIFQNLKYLHKVEIKDNRLVKIANQVFVNVPLLSQIYLNNNRLSFLRKESFESVKRLTALSLDGNPWNCTCELQIFRDFVLRRNLYTPPTACYYPSHLRGMLWIEDQPEAFACKPRIIFPAKGASINTSKENVTLVCRVHASANTHISWDYGSKPTYKTGSSQLVGAQQQQQQRIHIQIIQDEMTKEKEFGRNLYISRLTIVGADKSDEGTYTCIAENAGGKDSVQMTLLVQKAGARDMLQGNLAAVISLMALGLLSVSVFLAMVTCCIYKRFIASASAHQHRHHHLDLSGNDPLTVHGTVVANHGSTTMTGNTDVMLGVVDDDTLKYKKHHQLQQTTLNGGTMLIKDKYSELIKQNGSGGGGGSIGVGGGGGDSMSSGNSPLMEQNDNSSMGGGNGNNVNCNIQLGHLENKYYEHSNDDMLHTKYSHGRALAEVNTLNAATTAQHIKGRSSSSSNSINNDGKFICNSSGITGEFQPDLLPAYAGNKINSQNQQQHQGDQLYSPVVITTGKTNTNKTINLMEDQQQHQPHATLPLNTSSRSKFNTSAQEYLQTRFGTITRQQKSQEKLNTLKRDVPTIAPLTAGSSSLTVTRSSPASDMMQTAGRHTKSLFLPQRTVCSATTTITPTDTTTSYEYRQPPPPPYNAAHRTGGNLLMTRRTSLNQHDNNEDNNKNSNTKDQGYRELVAANSGVGIPLYETARQTIVTASPSMNFPTTITGYNTNTASPRRQLL